MESIIDTLQFEGYKGYHLDNFNFDHLKNILELKKMILGNHDYRTLASDIMQLDSLTWDEIVDSAKKFYANYFNLHNINYIDEDLLDKTVKDMPDDTKADEFYKKINGVISSINPFCLPVEIVKEFDFGPGVRKPLYIYPGDSTNENRSIYFSKIKMGRMFNTLTPCVLIHEHMHLQLDSVLGYTDDYFNREVLSIFIEKVAAFEMDKTGKLLNLFEKLRFQDLVNQYDRYLANRNCMPKEDMLVSLTYIKSTLVAEKMFDMYLQERMQSRRDKYIDDVQDVMDGRVKLEEIIDKRGIMPNKCKELSYLKRHI